jgi:c-di-GMP-binding flagellar brake protein YcgR
MVYIHSYILREQTVRHTINFTTQTKVVAFEFVTFNHSDGKKAPCTSKPFHLSVFYNARRNFLKFSFHLKNYLNFLLFLKK